MVLQETGLSLSLRDVTSYNSLLAALTCCVGASRYVIQYSPAESERWKSQVAITSVRHWSLDARKDIQNKRFNAPIKSSVG